MRSDCNIADIIIDTATAAALSHKTAHPQNSGVQNDATASSAAASAAPTLSQLCAARAQPPRFAFQAAAFMARSLLQQRRELPSLYLELFLSFLSGSLMGATSGGASIFTGVLIEPFSLMSPAPALFSLPLLSFFIGLTIGVSASPPAVRVFGNEKHLVRSEGSAGCSRSAYYVGKSLSVMPRLTLCAFHFSSIFYLLMAPRASFASVFAAIWALNYCVYGLAAFLSVLSREGNSALLAVIVSMALAALCGYSPSLADASDWGMSVLWDLQCAPVTRRPRQRCPRVMQVYAMGGGGVLLQRGAAVDRRLQHKAGGEYVLRSVARTRSNQTACAAAVRRVRVLPRPMGDGHLHRSRDRHGLQDRSAASPPVALPTSISKILQQEAVA